MRERERKGVKEKEKKKLRENIKAKLYRRAETATKNKMMAIF